VRGTTGTGNNAGNAIGTCGLCEFGEQIRGAVRGYDPRLVLDALLRVIPKKRAIITRNRSKT
jgi:hypothetical protein